MSVPLELRCPGLTYGLAVGMAHVDVERSVGGVDERFPSRAVVFVALLHRARVPVRPVHAFLEHRDRERMRQDAVVHGVPVIPLQIRESEETQPF